LKFVRIDPRTMMTLRTLNLPTTLDTSRHDLAADFFVPLLTHAQRYDRGVGYFSSGWLRLNAAGMVPFAANGGRARWITSPILDSRDWEALQAGDAARDDALLRLALRQNVEVLAATLERDTLSALAWMVADGILTFKLAVPRKDLHGQFHAKFGVFSDAGGNQVSFSGSYNDSIHGTENYEEITVFWSWEAAYEPHIQATVERFERLWNNQDQNVRAFELPEAVREQILQLRTAERPYPEPEWLRLRRTCEQPMDYRPNLPGMPDAITLRDYQLEAITAWFAHDCRGLLEMATGTGKTITALAASVRLFGREGRLAVIIAVPYQHLVDQWHAEAQAFGYQPVLAYQTKKRWLNELNSQIMEFNGGYRRFISVIVTHTTFAGSDFQNSIGRLNGPALLLADEAHHLGAERGRQSYPEHVPFRLALSATPDRWFDDAGTEALRDYFGETVFAFPLEQAIGVSLTPYYYHPQLVALTEEELERYEALSAKIARLIHRKDDEGQRALKLLLVRRAELLNKADNKLAVLSDLVDQQEQIEHTLFYCAPGQIDEVLQLLGWEKGLLVRRFTAEETPRERQELLTDFASSSLQGLVAMKCLDEGVDVPSTRMAFFLASSSNPREFVQRRGRILRKSLGKEFSIIYDLVAVPPSVWNISQSAPTFEVERSIIRRELERFKEFAAPALNKHQALDVVWDIAKRYGLMDF
jgi:superfamily II DNA or RNA helicase